MKWVSVVKVSLRFQSTKSRTLETISKIFAFPHNPHTREGGRTLFHLEQFCMDGIPAGSLAEADDSASCLPVKGQTTTHVDIQSKPGKLSGIPDPKVKGENQLPTAVL